MENGSMPNQSKAKMSGYLEKKNKMPMVGSWKKYWFVLQDRLLLFYRSKDEYEAISACKGSINLGPPCSIKSYPSVQHAFQIVTRATSFTLRAENAVDQKKWMQTIMYALNQDNTPAPNQTIQPPSSTAAPQPRLNHFRYSLDDLVPEVEPAKPFDRANSDLISRIQKMGGMSYGGSLGKINNPQMGAKPAFPENKKQSKCADDDNNVVVRNKKSFSNENFNSTVKSENLYERISSDSSNDGGGDGGRGASRSLYERITYVYPHQANSCERVQSLYIDNENYSVPVKKTQSLNDGKSNRDSSDSFIIENAIYGQHTCHQQGEEAIYAEPHKNNIDHNENDLLVENTIYESSPINRNCNNNKRSENLYECVENVYWTPEEVICKKSPKKAKKNSAECQKPAKVKKSKSFMKRLLLSKKSDSKKTKQQQEQDCQQDDRSGESAIYDEIDPKVLEKFTMNDNSAVQMLTELTSILESKKPKLKKLLSDPIEPQENSVKPRQKKISVSSDKLCASPPLLPLKLNKQNNNDISPDGTVYSKWHSDTEQPRSLDEILEDLDRDSLNPQPESKNKIKRLIEKFDSDNNNVILRKKHKNNGSRNFNRYSDELDYLLEELAKITSAPIMAPGAHNSLMDPTLHDEQWLKLIPKRQRRLSEPDYDVPRPLKFEQKSEDKPKTEEKKDESLNVSMTPDSLEIDAAKKIIDENCYDFHHHHYQYEQCNKGLAQDLKCFSQRYQNENNNNNSIYAVPKSYVSVATHIVNTCQNICSSELMAEEHTIIYKTVKNIITESADEVFTDSLELNESLTKF